VARPLLAALALAENHNLLIFKDFEKLARRLLCHAHNKNKKAELITKTTRNDSDIIKIIAWRRSKLILLEKIARQVSCRPDRERQNCLKAAPEPVEPARAVATSATKIIRLFFESRMGRLAGLKPGRVANKNNKPVSRKRTKQHALKGSLDGSPFYWLRSSGSVE